MPGIGTLAVEGTQVSRHCFWLLLDDEELAIPFSDFPRIKRDAVGSGHLHSMKSLILRPKGEP